MKVEFVNRKVIIEIPFEEFTHVYSDPIDKNLYTGEVAIGFGIEVRRKPEIDLKLQIKDGAAATYIMQELAKGATDIKIQ